MPLHSNRGELVQAIYSIPAYISRCAFFFALCPVIDSATQSKVFTPFSWSDRGWCRFERACRELSENASWILIRSRTELELIASPFASIGGSAGEGAFTLAEDKLQLAEVLRQALQRKLHLLLQKEDLEGYRVLLNLQHVHLRGFSVQPWRDLVPGFEDFGEKDPSSLRVSRFLHENGFSSVRDVDSRGWSPLHYAALAGDALVVESLLEQRADLHRVTQKDQPQAGVQPWASALAICVMFKHSKATRLLVAAKAQLDSGIQPPLHLAAAANNVEGIRILCGAGCKVHSKEPVACLCKHECARACACGCVCVFVCLVVCLFVCLFACFFFFFCVCVCLYIRLIFTYIFVYVYIHLYA